MRILGQCVRRYNPKKFSNVDAAILSIVDKVLLTNQTFFGGPCDWASNRITVASYDELAKKSDPIVKDIHDKRCTRITQDGGDFRVVILDKHAYNECKNWFPKENVINDGIFLH